MEMLIFLSMERSGEFRSRQNHLFKSTDMFQHDVLCKKKYRKTGSLGYLNFNLVKFMRRTRTV